MTVSIGKSSLARAAAAAGTRPTPVAEVSPVSTGLQQVAVEAITPAAGDKFPARVADELVQSVAEKGILEPLILAQTAPNTLTLIAGARRLVAAQKTGLTTVPSVIREMSASEASAARKEIKRFAAPAAKAAKAQDIVPDGVTTVGQSMPDWLL